MGLFTKSAAQIKTKALKEELKLLRKEFISCGMDKNDADARTKELREIMEPAIAAFYEYRAAKEHLLCAKAEIPEILAAIDREDPPAQNTGIAALIRELEEMFHGCLIRKDDPDFVSTLSYLKRVQKDYPDKGRKSHRETAMNQETVMLRSELENTEAVLNDVAKRSAPDFMALSYYILHEDRFALDDMENEQRNLFLAEYFDNNYRKEWMIEMERCKMTMRITELLRDYLE